MRTHDEIRDELREMKPSLRGRYGVTEIGVFGSYVREEQDEDSDIDIVVEFEDPIGLIDFLRLENELADHFEADVDLVTKKSLRPQVEPRVLNEVEYA